MVIRFASCSIWVWSFGKKFRNYGEDAQNQVEGDALGTEIGGYHEEKQMET